jgi:HEAT repeats
MILYTQFAAARGLLLEKRLDPRKFDSRFSRILPIRRFAAASIIARWQHGKQTTGWKHLGVASPFGYSSPHLSARRPRGPVSYRICINRNISLDGTSMSRVDYGRSRTALAIVLISAALVLPGCAKRFGGQWPFGEDQTAQLKKYGPVPVQRITEMQEKAKKLAKAKPEEQEAFAAELARQMPNENDFNVRMAVIKIMGTMNAPSANAILFAGLKDPEPEIRATCCESWGKRPSEESTRMLAEVLSGDTDLDVRMAAAKSLSSSHSKEAIAALGRALDDPDPGMQHCAVASLKKVTGKNLGNDVSAWRELAQRPDPPIHTQSLASRLWQIF